MRPLRLSLRAFGPYRDALDLDFARLDGGALFLLQGATGSGKTSILDGLCFALYGDSSGGERDASDVRSHHAPVDCPTEATLDFALGEERYRVMRRPARERPKARGEGTTREAASATLWRLGPDGDTEVLATGWSKVTDAVRERLGFDSAQFRQVVILPQGRFREVLTADSKTREGILRTLFRTDHYQRVEAALKQASLDLVRDLKVLDTRHETLRAQAAAQLGVDAEALVDAAALAERLAELDGAWAALRDDEQAADATDRKAEAALQAGKTATDRLREAEEAERARAGLEAKRPRVEEAKGTLGRARAAAPLVERAEAAGRAGARLQTATREEQAAREGARAAQAALEAAHSAAAAVATPEAEARREAARRAVGRLEDLRPRAEERAGLAREVQQRRGALERAVADVERTSVGLDRAKEALRALRAAWESGQAAVLARGLEAGAPCPVCGATDHPSPARDDAAVPEERALRTAERAEADAASALAAAQQRRTETGAQLEALATKLGELDRVLGDDARDAAALARALEEATRRRDALATEERRANEALQRAEREGAVAAERLAGAARELLQATDDHRARQEAFARGLAEAGFADADAFRAAWLDAARIEALQARVDAWARELAAAEDRARRAAEAAKGVEKPDLEALLASRERAAKALRDLRERKAALEERRRLAASTRETLTALEAERETKHARYGVLGRLSELATGQNPRRLSFQRFVLAALLDEVLEVASRRLAAMSRGRYRLRRRQEGDDLRRLSGLDLDVEDAWTNTERHAATLSGGEGFQAALALALGLADVVQRHAGGIRLDALFVDEGFGSLDGEALDLALDTLLGLREGGRLVGIVSHVPELAERIDVRLEVTGGPDGSTARLALP